MKRVFFISMILLGVILTGCRKDAPTTPDDPEIKPEPIVEPVQPVNPPTPVKEKMLIFNDIEVIGRIISKDEAFPIASGKSFVSSKGKSGVKMASYDLPEECSVQPYRFKLVNQNEALIVPLEGDKISVQATHVQIDDQYAYVSYNKRGEPNIGGLVVYKYTVHHGELEEEAAVDLEKVSTIRMPYAQINAIDFDGSRLYIAGATDRPKNFFGISEREDRAFLMILEVDADRKFKEQEPVVKQLTSYQATSIRKYKDKIYVTVGDGTDGPPPMGDWENLKNGGLFVYNANDLSFNTHILGLEHARSVDVDDDFVYLYQANHARVSKYSHNNLDINGKIPLYEDTDEAWQRDAKSEIMTWKDYIFVAQNETGFRMLFKDGRLNQAVRPPNSDSNDWDHNTDVTNSMSMNSDPKRNTDGKYVQSDLLLVANGERGIAWYDITKPTNNPNGKDWIYGSSPNTILGEGEGSANYIASSGNVVFVADGAEGLKVLYIGFNPGEDLPPDGESCTAFMEYVYFGIDGDNLSSFFPESRSVFRSGAHEVVKKLFQEPSRTAAANLALKYIEIQRETSLYITYQSEGAGFNNALGYFVIPADVPKNDAAEYDYWIQHIKPNMCERRNGRNILKNEYIIFDYIREEGDRNGKLIRGTTYKIGGDQGITFKPGERVVLFMCPDGFSTQNNYVEVTYDAGSYDQIFFMHKYFNIATHINISPIYNNGSDSFGGVQFNSFYSADCKSMVLLVEDWLENDTDADFNDIILSISDNIEEKDIASFVIPYWTVGTDEGKDLIIFPSSDIQK